MTAPLRVGDQLIGFCGGAFGRDSYADKRVEGIGTDWVVAREEYGQAVFANGNPDRLICHLLGTEPCMDHGGFAYEGCPKCLESA